nr:MAG TPA: hypothetical protein [Caudoviricetes sp.]
MTAAAEDASRITTGGGFMGGIYLKIKNRRSPG